MKVPGQKTASYTIKSAYLPGAFGENVSGASSLAVERNLGNRARAARPYANCQ